jgi:hypothetical protein
MKNWTWYQRNNYDFLRGFWVPEVAAKRMVRILGLFEAEIVGCDTNHGGKGNIMVVILGPGIEGFHDYVFSKSGWPIPKYFWE